MSSLGLSCCWTAWSTASSPASNGVTDAMKPGKLPCLLMHCARVKPVAHLLTFKWSGAGVSTMLFNRRRCQALGQEEAGNQRQATGRTSCSSCRRPAPALRPRSGSSSSDSLKRKDSHQVLDMLLSRSSHLRTPEQVILCFPKRFALHHALRPCLGASNIHLALVSLQKNLLKSMAWSLPSSAPQAHGWAIAEEQLVQVRALGTLVSLGANPEHSQAYF